MKRLFFLLTFLPQLLKAQSSNFHFKGKAAVVGLELAQNLPAYTFSDKYPIRNTIILEPSIGFNVKDRKWTMFTAGYANGYVHEEAYKHISKEKFEGGYARISFETQNSHARFLRVAFGPQLALYSVSGTYTFSGATFGDYNGHFQELFFVPGAHAALILDTAIGSKLRFRLSGQFTTGVKIGENMNPAYTPGYGFTYGPSRLLCGFNGGLYLFYNLR